ncbi:MAG: TonB-dependent receptor [Saprospiraceae bacterium]|nr:TonB-dependent receptor [Saprospiraceae bacterium]
MPNNMDFLFIKTYTSILIFLIALTAKTQSGQISGKILDTKGQALVQTSVILLDPVDSAMLKFVQTNEMGKFTFEKINQGSYLISISYIGYKTHWLKVEIKNTIPNVNLGIINLQSQNYILPELEIRATVSPIKYGKDTIEYNTAAFKVEAGDLVEDLLKKLPGVEVERDGTVKAYGETVENVMVDGKEFFGKDTRIATKNLEADAIDKVQVFDKKSDQSAFTGVDDGRREKTINLQLKENKKNGYFGSATVGIGTHAKGLAKLNLNQFNTSSRTSFIGSANNLNDPGFSMQEYIDFMGGLGAFMSGSGGRYKLEINTGSGIPLVGTGQIPGIQKSYSGGLNYSKDISSKTEFTGSLFYTNFANTLQQMNIRQNTVDSEYFTSSENKRQYSANSSPSINLLIKHKLDSSQKLIFRIQGLYPNTKLENSLNTQTTQDPSNLLNTGKTESTWQSNSYKFNTALTWMKKIKKAGRSFIANLSGMAQKNTKNGFLTSVNQYFINGNISDSLIQRQPSTENNQQYEGSVSFTEPIGYKKYIELTASHSNLQNTTENEYFDILSSKLELKNELQSKKYQSTFQTNSAGLNVLVKKNKYYLTAGLKMQFNTLDGKILTQNEGALSKKYFHLYPTLFSQFDFGTMNHLNVEYETNLQPPAIEQLQPIEINSDPLNIYVGNPDLDPEYNHLLTASYFLYDQFNFTSVFANLSGSYIKNKITDVIYVDSIFRRTIKPANVPYERSIRGGIDFNTPIRPLKINARIKLGTAFSNGIIFINADKNETTRKKYTFNFSIENRNKEQMDVILGWKIVNNKTQYSKSLINSQNFREAGIYADLTLNPIKKITIKSNFEIKSYTSSQFSEKITIPLWEISISHLFLKDNKLKVQCKVFDLLNKNRGIQRTSQQNYIEEQRSNVLGRYAMLQLGYSIRGFSAQKKEGIEIKIEQ